MFWSDFRNYPDIQLPTTPFCVKPRQLITTNITRHRYMKVAYGWHRQQPFKSFKVHKNPPRAAHPGHPSPINPWITQIIYSWVSCIACYAGIGLHTRRRYWLSSVYLLVSDTKRRSYNGASNDWYVNTRFFNNFWYIFLRICTVNLDTIAI